MRVIIGLLFITNICFSQEISQLTNEDINKSGVNKLIFADSTSQAVDLAKIDIANGKPFLLLKGGISPIVYDTDEDFENKYNVYFYDFGCIGPDDELSSAYNYYTFEYLTKTFGSKWTKMIRKDVIGLKSWKKHK